MDKQAQDKRWNELSEESKDYILSKYNNLEPERCEADRDTKLDYEDLFGSHNLNPKPQIKTWEDVENYYKNDVSTTETFHIYFAYGIEKGIDDKCFATLKIAKLIELGYGGMVSEEEWKDDETIKFGVKWSYKADDWVYHNAKTTKEFIAFHTPEQREEFMSYESNRILVRQYYMM